MLRGARTGEEFLDLGEQRVLISRPDQVLVTGQLDEPRARNLICDPAALVHGDVTVCSAMDDQRRDGKSFDLGKQIVIARQPRFVH